MTTIGNNNPSNSSPLVNTSLLGAKDSSGSRTPTSFMDIISMLSLNSETDFEKTENSELLINLPESEKSISNLSLLKQFLSENGIISGNSPSKTETGSLPNDTAAKFLAMLQKKNSSELEHTKVDEGPVNPENLPADKVLLNIAMKDVMAPYQKVEGSAEVRFESSSVSEKKVSSQDSLNLTKAPKISQFMINSSILDDAIPKTVVINFENIIKEAPVSFDEFRIAKIFTAYDKEENSSNSNIAKLDITISPDFAELRLENEDALPETGKVFLNKNFSETSKILEVSIERPMSDTLITTIQASHFRSEDSIPDKIYITFHKPITPNIENNSKISITSESDFYSSDLIIDTDHIALLTKVGSDKLKEDAEGLVDFQILKPKVNKDIFKGNNLAFVNMEDTTRSFSDRLSTGLESVISGEFGGKQILQKLDSFLRKKDGETNLNRNLRSPIFELLKSVRLKAKPALMSSTADILMYKQAISTNDKQVFDFQWIDAISDGPVKENLKILSGTIVNEDVEPTSINKETRINPNSLVDTFRQSSVSQNVQVRAQPNMVNLGINSTLNSLNLYDAHFSSRLSMLITDQVINGTENFELQLEPESFGKVRINVSLESSNVDVKMVAENSAAVLALRGSENILQNIAEQNGLKLSDYSVDMQNNQNGENSKRKNLGDEGEVTKSENNKSLEENALALNADNTYKLNLLA